MNPGKSQALPILLLLLSAVLQVVAFYPAMNGEFIADDENLIIEKAAFFGDPAKLGQAFSEPYWVRTRESLPFYRPLVLVTFFADRALWEFEPFGYHLTNLLLHLSNGILVFILCLALTSSRWTAVAAALIFGLHPAHLTSVAWISGRTDLLAVFFLLPAAALFIRGCREKDGGWAWIAPGALCFFLALLAKEVSLILLPFTLVWLFAEGRWRTCWRRWAPLAVVTAAYLLMRWGAGSFSVVSPGAAPFIQRVLTMPALLLYYLKLFFWPADWNFAPLIPPVASAADWRLWAGLFAAGAVGTAVVMLWKRNRPAAYSAVFALLALLPVSGLVPLYAPAREWWAYTASVGVAWALAPLAVWIIGGSRPAWCRRAGAVLLLLLLALCATWGLHRRSGAFASTKLFWRETVERAPHWDVAWNYLGLTLRGENQGEEAARCFSRAMQLRPDMADYPNNLGLIHAIQGQADEAERLFLLSRRLDPEYEDPRANLGLLLSRQGRLDEAEVYFLEALRLQPENCQTLNDLATLYIRRREPQKAVGPVSRSLALDPRQANAVQMRAFLGRQGAGRPQSR